MTERYSGDNVEAVEVWKWYKRTLQKIAVPGVPKGYWHYSKFSNGVTISKRVRELYRSRKDLYNYFDDPFSVEGDCFWEWLKNEQPELLTSVEVGGFQPI